MSQRKNTIRAKIKSCFLCGFEFQNIAQKILHRINKHKNSSENNVVVLCEDCRKYIQIHCEDNIYAVYAPIASRRMYFHGLGKNYRAIIMSKIRYFKNKDERNESKKESYDNS